MVKVHITHRSSNEKTGKIPVTTTEESSCPTTCPFYGGSCYAKSGFHLREHWKKVSSGERGTDWQGLTDYVRSLPAQQLWRMNQAGDVPHMDGYMRLDLLKSLVDANKASDAKGYTYTHHLLNTHNVEAIKYATNNGFTINCSTESYSSADDVIKQGMNAVTVIPSDSNDIKSYKVTVKGKKKTFYKQNKPIKTPDGNRVVICPAQQNPNVDCKSCGLCATHSRTYAIAFVAHGGGEKKINTLLNN